MSERKLVSAVTGTWNRHEMLLACIENVREQTYRPLEHVIVTDGPDPELRELVTRNLNLHAHDMMQTPERYVPITFVELGFHTSTVLTKSISACPFMTAQLLAKGDYGIWWADDERALVPDHVERLVDIIEEYDVDFAYPLVKLTWPDSDQVRVIGTNPPRNGTITHLMYRREALDRGALFRPHVGSGTDWDATARMMASKCTWAFLREVTFSHEVNK